MSESCSRRTSTARPPTSSGYSRASRTSGSSRARTSSPPSIAHPDKADVDRAYLQLAERALRGGAFVAVATHDERIIRRVLAFVRQEGIARDRFQLQMLYGVRPALQRRLAAAGYDVLVATPFGPEWYPYLMRRLAERPANILFFLRNLFRR